MLPTTREWVQKAEGDYDIILFLIKSRKKSRYDPICFHCQQCIEKYIKPRLNEAGIAFPKMHVLGVVLNLALAVEPLWSVYSLPPQVITDWGVLPCYPGTSANGVDAKEAAKICRRFREAARTSLGL